MNYDLTHKRKAQDDTYKAATNLPCSRLYAYMSTNLKSLRVPSWRAMGESRVLIQASLSLSLGYLATQVNSLCVEVDYLEFLVSRLTI